MSDPANIAPAEPAVAENEGTPVAAVPDVIEPTPEHTEEPTLLTAEAPAETTAEVPAEPVADPAAEAEGPAAPKIEEPEAQPEPGAPKEPEPPAPPEPLVYEPPVVPEGITLDADRVKAFDDVIGAARVPAEARQELVDMFLAERQSWEAAALRAQHEAFAQTRRSWREQVMSDEQLGGAGFETARAACLRMIDEFVPEQHRADFSNMLLVTGAGDHPAMMRFLHAVSRKFDAPAAPMQPNNPPADIGGGRRRMRDMYEHPRSRSA